MEHWVLIAILALALLSVVLWILWKFAHFLEEAYLRRNYGDADYQSTNDPNRPEPPPPWIYRPGSQPFDGRWRQGIDEPWFVNEWLPFWRNASPAVRSAYLARYPSPDETWHEYLTEIWLSHETTPPSDK